MDMNISIAADILGLSRPTVYSLIAAGRLTAHRVSPRRQLLDADEVDDMAGTPGLYRAARATADTLDALARDAGQAGQYGAAADLSWAAVRLRHLSLHRDRWHDGVLQCRDVTARHLPSHPALDALDTLLQYCPT